MSKHSEKDFILPTLFVIYNHEGGCTTDVIKDEVRNYITLNDDDLTPLPSRNRTEPGYYQIVGNLISHKNPGLLNFIELNVPESEAGKKSPKYLWNLNENGKTYIETIIKSAKEDVYKSGVNAQAKLDAFDEKIIQYASTKELNGRPITDGKITDVIKEINNYQCKYAQLSGEKHNTFNAKNGNKYIEVHHIIPLKASIDFFPRSLDRPSNMVCLCPNCHLKLHRGSEQEKRKILQKLYDEMIEGLNSDEIYISFDELLAKYYK